jgi:phenylalanyl-tRNA synthetase alpha chain
MKNIENLHQEILSNIAAIQSLEDLDDLRVASLGKKGAVTAMMKQLGGMDPETRKQSGQALNLVKKGIADAIHTKKIVLEQEVMAKQLESEFVDVSLPVRPETDGLLHPISQTIEEIVSIFSPMGFQVADGPDIEDDFHNFTALNFPADHPAREMHDTFFLNRETDGDRYLLRTHTSPVQVRTMRDNKPPIRILVPGRTYRCDYDITHTPMFHQIEGLVIDKAIHMGHLKGCLIEFAKAYFAVDDLPIRFRPSFFPFTEPSAEVDIGCSRSDGELKIGTGADWLEILGCGMVHPNVLISCGLDPEEYQGFAFGLGVERVAMLKYGIPDLRTFFESDLRWLRHYGFSAFDVPTISGGGDQ